MTNDLLVFDTSALFNFGHRDTLPGLLQMRKSETRLWTIPAVPQLRANGFFLPRVDDDQLFDVYLGRFGRV